VADKKRVEKGGGRSERLSSYNEAKRRGGKIILGERLLGKGTMGKTAKSH